MRKMIPNLKFIKIVALMLFFGYGPLSWADIYQAREPEGEVLFEVESTLHRIEGKAGKWFGTVDFDSETGVAVTPFEIHVPIQSLNTGHPGRDKAMMKMFGEENHPEAVWKVTEWKCPDFSSAKGGECSAFGDILIHGKIVRQDISVNLQPTSDGFRARAEIGLKTDDFGLKPPSVLGIIRVAKQVKVFINTDWKKSNEK